MAYSGAIADILREHFSASGILATFEDKNGVGVFTIRLKLSCRMQSAQMVVLVREKDYSTITTLPPESRSASSPRSSGSRTRTL